MKYFVVTPPYEQVYGEYGSDVAEVEATSKREALVKGLRELRRMRSRWLQDQASDRHSPFAGLKAEPDADA